MIEQHTMFARDLVAALVRGVTVVTGNTRLAGVLREAVERAAMEQGREAWPTPDVLPWGAWLPRMWEEAVLSGVAAPALVLSPQQERHLWETIITDITERLRDQPLQQVRGAASRAQDAWQLMQSWRLPLEETVFQYNHDSVAFREWALKFEARCAEQGWLPMPRLADELRRSVEAAALAVPPELVLTGFDELTPQQHSLLDTFREAGCEVRWVQLQGREGRATMVGCADARAEAAGMARWIRQRLTEKPDVRIGVVVPELGSQRDAVTQALDEVLVPEAFLPGRQSVARPYNLSLGPPLGTYPIVGTALKVLGLLAPVMSLEDLGRWLRSPFLAGWEQEAGARALLDGHLREAGELFVSLETLCRYASQPHQPHSCPQLAERLGAWVQAARQIPSQDSPGQWAERFAQLLRLLGWAGGRPLSSEEYQAAEAWRTLLGEFAALEPVAQPMSASAALAHVRRLADERPFQPQTGAVPVQVLGMLEASGLQFDALWIMGLHDGVWPPSPRPNPFLPLPWQREAGLPHSSEERELRVSRAITRRLLAAADEVVVSFPERCGDEALRPSPLLAGVSLMEGPGEQEGLRLWPGPTWRDEVHRNASVERLADDPAPPLDTADVHGGSDVWSLQAACPFRAFAELRLGAQAFRQTGVGLDAKARGSLIHRVLDSMWEALGSHEHLVAKDAAELEALIADRVAQVMDETARKYPQTLTGRYRLLEAERVRRRVSAWLEQEKPRAPFRVIEREHHHHVTAGGIRARVKIDRLDELADGRRVVIDYKTGEVKLAQWFGERPDEPQLPLYSMAVDGDLAGLLFAQVKVGNMAFNGVAEDDGVAPGVPSFRAMRETRDKQSWAEVLAAWRATMERLGDAFRRGEAGVDPKKYPDTCRYCALTPLCRINELTVLDGETSDTAETSDTEESE